MGISANSKSYLDILYLNRVKDLRLTGLHVSAKDSAVSIYSGTFGHSDLLKKTPLTKSHRFPAASISKLFTATRILQLVEQGSCKLTTTLKDVLPGLKRSKKIGSVTLEELLSHSSGMIRDGHDAAYWACLKNFPTVPELAAQVGDGLLKTTKRPIGYSNFSFAVLGLVISELEQASYEESIFRNIIKPLRLSATSFEYDQKAITRYAFLAGKFIKLNPSPKNSFNPAAGIISNPADIHTFLRALFFEKSLITSSAILKNLSKGRALIDGSQYSLGCRLYPFGKKYVRSHTGAEIGCYSFAGACLKTKRTYVSYTSEASDNIIGDPRLACKGLDGFIDLIKANQINNSQAAKISVMKSFRIKPGIYRNFFFRMYLYDNGSTILGLPLNSWSPTDAPTRILKTKEGKLTVNNATQMLVNDEPVNLAKRGERYSFTVGGHPYFSENEFQKTFSKLPELLPQKNRPLGRLYS